MRLPGSIRSRFPPRSRAATRLDSVPLSRPRRRKRRFHRGRSGLYGHPADNDQRHHDPTLLAGAAAMVLNSLQPANSLIPLGGSPTPTPTPTPTPSPTSSAVAGAVLPGTFHPTNFIPPLGTSFVPTVSALSAFNYAPIPLSVALQQYLPPDGFIQRDYAYNHPGKTLPPTLEERGQNQSRQDIRLVGSLDTGQQGLHAGSVPPGQDLPVHSQGPRGPRPAFEGEVHQRGQPARQGLTLIRTEV